MFTFRHLLFLLVFVAAARRGVAVQRWWAAKTDELSRAIPDFGGFLVKANSEGEPGPQDYQRTHAAGANVLAKALGAHDGVVMWRAFVYKADGSGDRFKEACQDFQPLDGTFDRRVLVQVWLQQRWAAARPALDAAVCANVAGRLQIQQQEGYWWRDACVLYFQTLARQPVPGAFAPPTRTLADIKRQVQICQSK
ncbi:MAG: hypothetical protein ACRYFR_12160 [Janthinobacterium lividum]